MPPSTARRSSRHDCSGGRQPGGPFAVITVGRRFQNKEQADTVIASSIIKGIIQIVTSLQLELNRYTVYRYKKTKERQKTANTLSGAPGAGI